MEASIVLEADRGNAIHEGAEIEDAAPFRRLTMGADVILNLRLRY